jgi:predicted RNA-binding Zn ribbon-like protein
VARRLTKVKVGPIKIVDTFPDQTWQLADTRLAVALLSTLQLRDGALVDELADKHAAANWLGQYGSHRRGRAPTRAVLVELRELLRELLTAIVDGNPPPRGAIKALNGVAARAPVTLVAREAEDGTVLVEPTSRGSAADALLAEFARSALALLAEPNREQLGLCRAPGCILFFLKRHPRQQWCSPSCGNRARVARHYTRHAHQ